MQQRGTKRLVTVGLFQGQQFRDIMDMNSYLNKSNVIAAKLLRYEMNTTIRDMMVKEMNQLWNVTTNFALYQNRIFFSILDLIQT